MLGPSESQLVSGIFPFVFEKQWRPIPRLPDHVRESAATDAAPDLFEPSPPMEAKRANHPRGEGGTSRPTP